MLYLFGHYGHEVDFDIAKQYLEQIDVTKEPRAAALLGRIYEFGLGVPQDGKKALEYYEYAISKVNNNSLLRNSFNLFFFCLSRILHKELFILLKCI